MHKQEAELLAGERALHFAAEDYEVDFKGRAAVDDLTELGRDHMGL